MTNIDFRRLRQARPVSNKKDKDKLNRETEESEITYHMAAQAAVTTSVKEPIGDFDIKLYLCIWGKYELHYFNGNG